MESEHFYLKLVEKITFLFVFNGTKRKKNVFKLSLIKRNNHVLYLSM